MYIIYIYAFRSIKLKFLRKQKKVVIGNKWSFTKIVAPKSTGTRFRARKKKEIVLSKTKPESNPKCKFCVK